MPIDDLPTRPTPYRPNPSGPGSSRFDADGFDADGFDAAGFDAGGPDPVRRMGMDLPTGRDPISIRRRVEAMEHMLERSFRLPGTNYPVGLDAVIGLVPVVGDLIAAALSAYIVWEGRNLGMPKWKLWRMGGNIAIDTAIGAIPLVGDAFDLAFRSNTRNLKIIRKHLDKHHPAARTLER